VSQVRILPRPLYKAKRYAVDTDAHLVKEVAKNLDKQGALFYLRNEMKFIGGKFKLCQFQPDLTSPALVEKYNQYILRAVRQVYYSESNQNSIDLVLFREWNPCCYF
jgi:type I restriction enzyme R subunit